MALRRSARISDVAKTIIQDADIAAVDTNDDVATKKPTPIRKRKDSATKPASVTKTKSSKVNAKVKDQIPDDTVFKAPPIPTTPQSKRRKLDPTTPLPYTPTPAAITLLSSPLPASSPHRAAEPRPADPHATNAPLQTPGGSRVLAYDGPVKATTTTTASATTTTTANLLDEAEKWLVEKDHTGKLKECIKLKRCETFSPQGLSEEIDPWKSLASSIIAQQVSGAAANSIKAKFIALFPCAPAFPSPSTVAAADIPTLRSAGLSGRKAEYIQGLAQKFSSGELSARMLVGASDEEVMQMLVAVRGLGRWSVEMFAWAGLKRMDVFSTGDLGVQRGMAAWLGRDVAKLKAKGGKWKYMSEKDMLDHSAVFAPYRSLFMWYMWRIEEVDIGAIAG